MTKLLIRAGRAADLPLIKSRWSRSFGPRKFKRGPAGEPWVKVLADDGRHHIAPALLHFAHRAMIDDVLERAVVLVGHAAADDRVIMGWLVAELEPARIHFVWVRKELRRRGYASKLLDSLANLGVDSPRPSHMTPMGALLLEARRGQR